jgi:hypothetical protein
MKPLEPPGNPSDNVAREELKSFWMQFKKDEAKFENDVDSTEVRRRGFAFRFSSFLRFSVFELRISLVLGAWSLKLLATFPQDRFL